MQNSLTTKKNTLILTGLLSVTLLVLNQVGTFKLCGAIEHGSCMNNLANAMLIFFPVFPTFIISAMVYFMHEEVFHTWIKFTLVWVPLTMFLVFISPEYGNALLPIVKGTVAFWSSALFLMISMAVIIWKWNSLRK